MSFSVDANVLLYASDSDSPFRGRAAAFLDECRRRSEPFCLTWPAVMGYLRIATHPSIFRHALTPQIAMQNVEELLDLPHVRLLSEDDGFWQTYRSLAERHHVRGPLVTDACIAAILRQHSVRTFYTHDRSFRRFEFLNVIDPFD